MRADDSDFEFERRFYVETLPTQLLHGSRPDVIVQTYFLAAEGYGLRVRLQATQPDKQLDLSLDGKQAIEEFLPYFDLCMLTVKGPAVAGTRYEAERELDVAVGAQMSTLGGTTLAKNRWGVWLDEDGWVIDQFAGANRPLIVAECERLSPVMDLRIPSFCVREITDDTRFSNDELVNDPFGRWAQEYQRGLHAAFDTRFGTNRASSQ